MSQASTHYCTCTMCLVLGDNDEGSAVPIWDLYPCSCLGRRGGMGLPRMVANAARDLLPEGTKEWWSCKEERGQQVPSLTAGVTGVMLRASCALVCSAFSPHTDHLCFRQSPLPELWSFPPYMQAVRLTISFRGAGGKALSVSLPVVLS